MNEFIYSVLKFIDDYVPTTGLPVSVCVVLSLLRGSDVATGETNL